MPKITTALKSFPRIPSKSRRRLPTALAVADQGVQSRS
jgi:hypothetical protein